MVFGVGVHTESVTTKTALDGSMGPTWVAATQPAEVKTKTLTGSWAAAASPERMMGANVRY